MVRRKLRPNRGNGAGTHAPQSTPKKEPVGRELREKVEPGTSSTTIPEPVGRRLRGNVEPRASSETKPTPEERFTKSSKKLESKKISTPRRRLRGKVEPRASSETKPTTPEERFTKSSKKLESKKISTPLTKRIRSFKTGFKALKEICHYQKTTQLLIPRSPFVRLVQEILFITSRGTGVDRIHRSAIEALQEAVETVIVQLFEDSMLCAKHAKRITLMAADIRLIRQLKGI